VHRGGKFSIALTGNLAERITVTLATRTVPPVILKLNAWKYSCYASDPPNEFFDHQRYFYEESTCPINSIRCATKVELNDDADPHDLFELRAITSGHLEDGT